MVSGRPLSDAEKQYIRANSDRLFPATIARDLAEKYRDHNLGQRSRYTVTRYQKSQGLKD